MKFPFTTTLYRQLNQQTYTSLSLWGKHHNGANISLQETCPNTQIFQEACLGDLYRANTSPSRQQCVRWTSSLGVRQLHRSFFPSFLRKRGQCWWFSGSWPFSRGTLCTCCIHSAHNSCITGKQTSCILTKMYRSHLKSREAGALLMAAKCIDSMCALFSLEMGSTCGVCGVPYARIR